MKIGIPRALLFYYYYPFWKTFFGACGCETVLSDETNAEIMSEGSAVSVSELCVPIKIYNGHVLNLLKKDVDYIFIPQFISMKKEWYCPKFIGILELTSYSIEGLDGKLLTMEITSKGDVPNRLVEYLPLCGPLGISKNQLKKAVDKAESAFERFRTLCRSGYTVTEAFDIFEGKSVPAPAKDSEITIGLMGYVYNVYDSLVSMKAIEMLRNMNVRIITFDMLDEAITENDKTKGQKLYWVFARKIHNAAQHLLRQQKIDGVIHLTAFGCGPDSVLGKMMDLDCEKSNIPFMTLRVDEHVGESHILTRLEAFIDMLKIKKSKGDVT